MSTTCVRETFAPVHEYEVARRWYALPPGLFLPLSSGDSCQLLFTGRPGSAMGPDVRDAVLRFSRSAKQCVGDVEFHVRASDWFTHQHHTDARYNSVLLHVVFICDHSTPALRQDGTIIPMCSLYDLPPPRLHQAAANWPCHASMRHLSDVERTHLLRQAGLLRFEQKTDTFVEQLHQSSSHGSFSAYDVCLIAALAEGLGFGRDRAFFRAAGRYLLGLPGAIPEPLGRTFDPSPLDASRLSVLRKLVEQWRTGSAWQAFRKAIFQTTNQDRSSKKGNTPAIGESEKTTQTWHSRGDPLWSPCKRDDEFHELRTIFSALGPARADILICNIVLPFAMAVALIENDSILAEQARRLYLNHPGLTSNRVTRAMCQQLQLVTEPEGACQQQGLHYIYQQTCREKRCELCIMGKRNV